MSDFVWHKKEALQEQLKFFGAKKQKFISVYARKPRVRVEVKSSTDDSCNTGNNLAARYGCLQSQDIAAMQRAQQSALCSQANTANLYSLQAAVIEAQGLANATGFGGVYSGASALSWLGN